MATNQRYTHSKHIALTVPEDTAPGSPVVVGNIAGVTQTGVDEDGRATVWLDGSYDLTVAGALTEGQPVYLLANGQLTSSDSEGAEFFGVAVTAKGSGDAVAEVAPAGIISPSAPAAAGTDD